MIPHAANLWNRTVGLTLDLLYPRHCVVCNTLCQDHHPHLCAICQNQLRYAMAVPACPRCAHSLGPYGVDQGQCHACRNETRPLDHLVRVASYKNELAPIIRAIKFAGHDELDLFLGQLLADALRETNWFNAIEALVCVPTHWTHHAGRSSYPPTSLTPIVSREANLPIAPVLRRTSGGPHQFNVPRNQRDANVRGRFALIRGASVTGAHLCLIDDVSTTGATANECARTLKSAGAASVHAAVLGKVDTAHHATLPHA